MEGLHQHVYGGSFLVSLHLSHDVLREDRTQAAEDITSKSRSAQLHSLHSNGQEVLLHPLSLLHLFCALSRGQSVLHKNADHRHFVFLDVCRWQNQRGGSAVSALNSCLDPVMYFLLSSSVRKEVLRLVNNMICLRDVTGISGSSSTAEMDSRNVRTDREHPNTSLISNTKIESGL